MTGRTTIEWTDQPGYRGAVWNPTTGCTRVSAGCDNCYAFALHDKRYATNLAAAERMIDADNSLTPLGLLQRREVVAAARPFMTLPWPKQYDLPFSRVQLLEDRLDVPLRTRTPTCYFVDSMADLFHEDVPDLFIDRMFSAMSSAARHRFLILTKRPERMREYVSAFKRSPSWDDFITRDGRPSNELDHHEFVTAPGGWPLPNVWLGTSVEDQKAADERIPHLLATPAAVRFLSCEPLLGPVDLQLGSAECTHRAECMRPPFPTCLCGARAESPRTHSHSIGCPCENARGGRHDDAAREVGEPVVAGRIGDRMAFGDRRGAGRLQPDSTGQPDRLGRSDDVHAPADVRLHALSEDRRPGVLSEARLDWVIVGGESGRHARPMDLAWARSLVAQCRAAGVAPFVKQLGSKPVSTIVEVQNDEGDLAEERVPYDAVEAHGRDMAEWPEDLRIREWPSAAAVPA